MGDYDYNDLQWIIVFFCEKSIIMDWTAITLPNLATLIDYIGNSLFNKIPIWKIFIHKTSVPVFRSIFWEQLILVPSFCKASRVESFEVNVGTKLNVFRTTVFTFKKQKDTKSPENSELLSSLVCFYLFTLILQNLECIHSVRLVLPMLKILKIKYSFYQYHSCLK